MRDYDILFGLLAYQLHLISQDTLDAFHQHGSEHPNASALPYLTEHGNLSESDHALLVHVIDTLVHAHRGDVRATLESFGGESAVASSPSPPGAKGMPVRDEDKTIKGTILVDRNPENVTTEQFGRYTGGSEYARGGIGRILLVHDEQIGRQVILKELLPEHAVSAAASTLSPPPRRRGGEHTHPPIGRHDGPLPPGSQSHRSA